MEKTVISRIERHANTILIILALLPLNSLAQNRINMSKTQVKEDVRNYSNKIDSIDLKVKETDSTLEFTMRAPKMIPTDMLFSFDKSGKCMMEKLIVYCDSCLNYYLVPVMNKKEYQWNKINENQWVSAFDKKLLLELPLGESDRSYIILRTDWSQKLYDMLLGKVKDE